MILMHDGGGDRSVTVAALPVLIDTLRAHGYSIVQVSALMGKTTAEVMPRLTFWQRMRTLPDSVAFSALSIIFNFIVLVFFLGDILMSARLILVGILAIIDRLRRPHRQASPGFNPRVAVLIPSYNEEKVNADPSSDAATKRREAPHRLRFARDLPHPRPCISKAPRGNSLPFRSRVPSPEPPNPSFPSPTAPSASLKLSAFSVPSAVKLRRPNTTKFGMIYFDLVGFTLNVRPSPRRFYAPPLRSSAPSINNAAPNSPKKRFDPV